MLGRLDLVVASVHSKLRMNAGPMTRRMVAAAEHPRVNVLGHCTGRLITGSRGTRPQSEFDARAVFEACGTSTSRWRSTAARSCNRPNELIALALEAGCLLGGFRRPRPGQLDFKVLGCERAERLGVPERIINTWDTTGSTWAAGS